MQIKRRDWSVAYEADVATMRDAVEAAVGCGADLRDAYLGDAYLRDAYLGGVDLRGAYLGGADLRGAYLRDAYLGGADLRGAYLRGVDLRGADLRDAYLGHRSIVPESGAFVGWKKVGCGVVKVLIPATADRVSPYIGRKCRASEVLVLEGGGWTDGRGHGTPTHYEPGLTVIPDSYDPDPRVECSHGIHFFITRAEAEEF